MKVLRDLAGHGVGRAIHEPPLIPNYDLPGLTETLTEGTVITIEPLVSTGTQKTRMASDSWTIRTHDGSPTAHFEHTIILTQERPLVVTAA